MELQLYRTHFKEGTNGVLLHQGQLVCLMIELPWKNNVKNVSCIPDGRYALQLRFTHRFGQHFLVQDVTDRSMILVHPANDALKELEGCLAPVLQHTGIGKGSYSRKALDKLVLFWEHALQLHEGLYLNIDSHDFSNYVSPLK